MDIEAQFQEYFEKLRAYDDVDDMVDNTEQDQAEALEGNFLDLARKHNSVFVKMVAEIPCEDWRLINCLVIMLSKDCTTWSSLFLDLLTRLFEEAKRSEAPEQIKESISAFVFLDGDEQPACKEICGDVRRLCMKHFDSPRKAVRYAAIGLFGIQTYSEDIEAVDILRQFKKDSDWRIRYDANRILNGLDGLPAEKGLGILDGIRALFLQTSLFG
ncbi:hypothetical protein ACFL1X_09310 [Candidatus Hydrogenedentota bacterium]